MDTTKTPMLELRDIYKSFGDVEVLKGISAKIDKGELLTFVGSQRVWQNYLAENCGWFRHGYVRTSNSRRRGHRKVAAQHA